MMEPKSSWYVLIPKFTDTTVRSLAILKLSNNEICSYDHIAFDLIGKCFAINEFVGSEASHSQIAFECVNEVSTAFLYGPRVED